MGSAQRAAVLWWRNFSATGQLSIPQILSLEFAVFLCFALARIGAEVSAMRMQKQKERFQKKDSSSSPPR